MELEDDLFFADLSKEIALLIMDEDEDPLASCPPDSLQVLYYFNLFKVQTHAHTYFFFPSSSSSSSSSNYGTLRRNFCLLQ